MKVNRFNYFELFFFLAVLTFFISNSIKDPSIAIISFFHVENIKHFMFLFLFVSVFCYFYKYKVKQSDVIFTSGFIVVLLTYFFFDYFFGNLDYGAYLKLIILLPFFYFIRINFKFHRSIYFLLIVFLFFTIYYSYAQGFQMGYSSRAIYSSYDPNISGMYLLLGFFLARKIDSRLFSIVFILLGFLTFSRNFMLAIFVFYLVANFKSNRLFSKIINFNFISILFMFNLILVLISYLYLNVNYTEGTGLDYSRFGSLADESNASRFEINRLILQKLFFSIQDLFFGLGSDYMRNESLKINSSSHNALLDFLGMYGVFYTLIYLFFLYLIFSKVNKIDNAEYIFSCIVFSLFLPGLLSSVYILVIIFILRLESKKINYKVYNM